MSIVFGNSTGTPVTSTVYTAGNISGDGSIGNPIVLISSPALIGAPTAPTPTTGSNNNYIATTAFVAATVVSYAPLNSPAFTGTPTAPTAAPGTNTTQIATTAFVVATVVSYAPLNSPAFTGTPTAPTPTTGDNSTNIATTAFIVTALTLYAPLSSPAFTGTPTAPTAAPGTNTTQIATTAFVQTANGAYLPITGGTITGSITVNKGFYTSGSFSAATWATNNYNTATGININIASATYTDTTGSGTLIYNSANQFNPPTLAASNTVTYSYAATVVITGGPLAGTNVTIGQSASLIVYNGLSCFNGGISTAIGTTPANFYTPGSTLLASSALSSLNFAGSTGINTRIFSNATTNQTLTANYNYATVIIGSAAVLTAATGTHGFVANMVVNTLGSIASGGAGVTNTATLYVATASGAGTNQYSLYVAGGTSYFGGIFKFSATGPTAYQIPVVNSGVTAMTYVYSGQTNTTLSAINSTGTATSAQIATGTITSTSPAITNITLDSVANIYSTLGASQGTRFKFNVDNVGGASLVTIVLPTGITAGSVLTGGTLLTVAAGTVGQFELYVHSNTSINIARLY